LYTVVLHLFWQLLEKADLMKSAT